MTTDSSSDEATISFTTNSLTNQPNGESEEDIIPRVVPVLPLRGLVVYPLTAVPLNIGQPRSIKLIEEATRTNSHIGLFTSYDQGKETPGPGEVYRIGTIAAVHRQLRRKDGTIRLLVNGLYRVCIQEFIQTNPFLQAAVTPAPEHIEIGTRLEALARNLIDNFLHLSEFVPSIPGNLLASSLTPEEPLQLAYTIATYIRLDIDKAQAFLELDDLGQKLEWLAKQVTQEVEVMEMGQRIRSEAFGTMEKTQREYFLREQMKVIQRELGESDEREVETADFRQKLAAANLPELALKEANRELSRLTRLPVASAEYSVVRTYLEWITSLPWDDITPDNLDLVHAREVLEEDHHGLEEIKERILEFLAVRRLRETRPFLAEDAAPAFQADHTGAILCLVGPPGVGKTSLGRSIARAMGRQFTRISLGGMRDEAEIRGHRRTYIGALPGNIIQALRRVNSKNPVIVLDEIDKLGADFRGDPAAALLEVLDPEQNREFRDHYLDVPFDLSNVLFITTANTLDPIPSPLRDRMELLRLAGYTQSEKAAIATQYLVPRQIRHNGLHHEEICFTVQALNTIIQDYTREAGVRELERQVGRVCRKVATAVANQTAESAPITTIDPAAIATYLGPARYFNETAERITTPGIATGLSWTSVGGSILFIEAAKMPGQKGLTLTGQLGSVMTESAQTALSYLRSQAERFHISPTFFDSHDIHIHVPAGAIPKDGPSGGVTIATALVSLLTGRLVRSDVGMTGEITLRGQVMPVGGIKEKVLAAHRAHLTTLIIPRRNQHDIDEIPIEVQNTLKFLFVDDIAEVFDAALIPQEINDIP